jgi:hypothetical protein
MQTAEHPGSRVGEPGVRSQPVGQRARTALTGGGTDGNEQLTSLAGAVLIVLLAALGITIVRIGQLIWLHLFLGLVLLGPLAVKIASVGYRFARYYTRNQAYRSKGPPGLLMRSIAPVVVTSTVVVFASGILLLIVGRRGRDQYLLVHKASFVVWLVFTAIHVLGHVPIVMRALGSRGADSELSGSAGTAGRWIALLAAVVGGLVLAIVLIPQFGPWTAHASFLHQH